MSSATPIDLASLGHDLLEVADNPHISAHLAALQHRITDLHDYRIFGSTHEEDPIHLYSTNYVEDNDQIVQCGTFDHTMFESIDEYCSQKFPVEVIKGCLMEGFDFEVHGIFPDHFVAVAARLGYTKIESVDFRHNKRDKRFNYVRPRFFQGTNAAGKRVFIVAVNSGRDYVFHYASMLRHVVGMFSLQATHRLKIIRYPHAESSIHVWTGLNGSIVTPGDLVILGYVEEMGKRFSADANLELVDEVDTDHYTSIRFRHKKLNTTINLVGIKFSFWGCISAKIVAQICRLGAREIIYVGKLGTLASPNDIYQRIFVPSEFLIMYHDKIVCRVHSLRNNLLARYPELSTGHHVSVPTVVEEDYVQRGITANLNINSIDNEVSQMAYAVAQFNRELGRDIAFSAIHFATDYIRRPSERNLRVQFDLSNNRTKEAFQRKIDILDRIATQLITYVSEKP